VIRQLRQRRLVPAFFYSRSRCIVFAPYANLACNQCPRHSNSYPRVVSLPLYPAMSEEQVDYVQGREA